MRKWAAAVLGVAVWSGIAVFYALPSSGNTSAAGAQQDVNIYVDDGVATRSGFSVAEGQVLDVGASLDASGACVLPDGGLVVGAAVSDPNVGSVSVRTSFDGACRLIIESIDVGSASPPGASKPPGDGATVPEVTSETTWGDGGSAPTAAPKSTAGS